jgi:integrase/recombinase XerD
MSDPPYLAPHVRSFFEDHLRCRRNVSSNTVRSYRDALNLLLRFAAGRARRAAVNLLVTDITEEVLVAFLTDLEQTRGNSIQTRNHRLVGIRRLFAYIGEQEPPLLGHCQKIVTVPTKRGALSPAIR